MPPPTPHPTHPDPPPSAQVLHYLGLSALYTVNNQLSFYILTRADPGSLALGKSVAPYLCALLLSLAGQRLSSLQWVCVIVQCCAIAIVQFDPCKNQGVLPVEAYGLIALATSITASTSVWNQMAIKGFDVPVNLQNTIMYSFGSAIAFGCHFAQPSAGGAGGGRGGRHQQPADPGFFEGYTPLAILLVVFQAFHGLAVALVYKYADAIVKNFANSSVMAILVVISALFLNLKTTVHSWLGVIIVVVMTHCYMNMAIKSSPPPEPPTPAPGSTESQRLLDAKEVGDAEEGGVGGIKN